MGRDEGTTIILYNWEVFVVYYEMYEMWAFVEEDEVAGVCFVFGSVSEVWVENGVEILVI